MQTIDIRKIIDDETPSVIASRMTEAEGRPYTLYQVSNWRTRGVPDTEVLAFCRAVNFLITPHQLLSRMYPHPDDGLPVELRKCEAAA